jgi:hypothetical protein
MRLGRKAVLVDTRVRAHRDSSRVDLGRSTRLVLDLRLQGLAVREHGPDLERGLGLERRVRVDLERRVELRQQAKHRAHSGLRVRRAAVDASSIRRPKKAR